MDSLGKVEVPLSSLYEWWRSLPYYQWMQGWNTAAWSASMAGLLGALYLYSNPYHIINWINRHQAWSAGWKRRSIKLARDYVISYSERGDPGGDDRPTILLIHGYGGTAHNWDITIKNMSQKHHLVAINLPGHEYSSCDADADLCMEGMLSRLHEFVTAIGLGATHLHVVGCSMGGAVAGCYAAKHPTFVKKLTLVCPLMITPEDSELVKCVKDTKYNPLVAMNKEGLKQTLNLCLNRDPVLPRPIFAAVLDYRRRHSEYHTKLMDNLMVHMTDERDQYLTESAPSITTPTQVIWGDNDRVVHASGATLLQSLLPNLRRFDILPNVGHSIYMITPKVLSDLLETFIEEDYSNDTEKVV